MNYKFNEYNFVLNTKYSFFTGKSIFEAHIFLLNIIFLAYGTLSRLFPFKQTMCGNPTAR